MKQWIWMIVFVLPVIMATRANCAEFYQYTDPQGNLVFTDDITTIPEGQRAGIQTHEAIRSEPALSDVADVPDADDVVPEQPEVTAEDAETDELDEPESSFASDASELPETGPVEEDDLDREKVRLDALHDQLMAERKRLSEMPVDQMNNAQRNVHQDNINRLNVRLREFDRQADRFQQSVREYNFRIQEESRKSAIPDDEESL